MTADTQIDILQGVDTQQRGFRLIIFAAIIFMVMLAVLVGILGWRNAVAVGSLRALVEANEATSEELRVQAFNMRQQQIATVISTNTLQNSILSDYAEVRRVLVQQNAAEIAPADANSALEAAKAYLRLGQRIGLQDERRIRTIVEAVPLPPEIALSDSEFALLRGVFLVRRFEDAGGAVQTGRDAGEHPDVANARAAFDQVLAAAQADRALRPLREFAGAGLARLDYIAARGANFNAATCNRLIETVSSSYTQGVFVPINIVWRADCLRKTGQSATALGAYGSALYQVYNIDELRVALERGDVGALTTAALAFEGLGATIISTSNQDAGNESIAGGLRHAVRFCLPDRSDEAERLVLARACIGRATEFRRRLRQTDIEVAGAEQVIGIALLRQGDYRQALSHAQSVDAIAPFAWNAAVRWIAARHEADAVEERRALSEARLFPRSAFNECELAPLLGEEMSETLTTLLEQTRDASQPAPCLA
ncbi:MAG: hypothetical protein H7124_04920 [Phycisphaerales bacterium]|nr:hypothetical protein [Hyphomonadaceae bacterium]